MEETQKNKMAVLPMKKLFWKMGLPMIVSMVLLAYLFTKSNNVTTIVWWTFPIAEIATALISIFILKKTYQEKIEILETQKTE